MKLSGVEPGQRVCWYFERRFTGKVGRVVNTLSQTIEVVTDDGAKLWLHHKALRKLVKKPRQEYFIRDCVNYSHTAVFPKFFAHGLACMDCKIIRVKEISPPAKER